MAAAPGTIVADHPITLDRPRKRKSPQFEEKLDELYSLIV
jgi:hypothetical protein